MTLTGDLIAQIALLQSKVTLLNSVASDTFNVGTVVVFAAGPQGSLKWYYSKIGEESWRSTNGGAEKSLAEWILHNVENNVGYFEVYELRVQPTPFFAAPS